MAPFPLALDMVGENWLVRGTVSHERDSGFFEWGTIFADL